MRQNQPILDIVESDIHSPKDWQPTRWRIDEVKLYIFWTSLNTIVLSSASRVPVYDMAKTRSQQRKQIENIPIINNYK